MSLTSSKSQSNKLGLAFRGVRGFRLRIVENQAGKERTNAMEAGFCARRMHYEVTIFGFVQVSA